MVIPNMMLLQKLIVFFFIISSPYILVNNYFNVDNHLYDNLARLLKLMLIEIVWQMLIAVKLLYENLATFLVANLGL